MYILIFYSDDKRHGKGLMTFLVGSPIEERYDGCWEDDEKHGYGHHSKRDIRA